jgi:hypothetical protein
MPHKGTAKTAERTAPKVASCARSAAITDFLYVGPPASSAAARVLVPAGSPCDMFSAMSTAQRPRPSPDKPGRPTDYTPVLGQTICEGIAAAPAIARRLRAPDMPGRTPGWRWQQKHAEFRNMVTAAREFGADALAEQCLMITDHGHELVSKLPITGELLRGTLLERTVRHTKDCAKCARGEAHQVLVLTMTYLGHRTRQISVPASGLPRLANYQELKEAIDAICKLNHDLLRPQQVASKPRREQRD